MWATCTFACHPWSLQVHRLAASGWVAPAWNAFDTTLQVIAESGSPIGNESRPFYDFLEGCLRHKAEMVIFEAARAICNMKDVSNRWALPACICWTTTRSLAEKMHGGACAMRGARAARLTATAKTTSCPPHYGTAKSS